MKTSHLMLALKYYAQYSPFGYGDISNATGDSGGSRGGPAYPSNMNNMDGRIGKYPEEEMSEQWGKKTPFRINDIKPEIVKTKCRRCDGAGVKGGSQCKACKGVGTIRRKINMNVLPPEFDGDVGKQNRYKNNRSQPHNRTFIRTPSEDPTSWREKERSQMLGKPHIGY